VHSLENQCRTFVAILEMDGIKYKIRFIMMDDPSNNDTFIDHLESAQLEVGYRFNACEQRLR